MHYELIIFWSKTDESFIVEVPELPGCMADGATYEEAVANAKVVVQEWIDTAKSLRPPDPGAEGKTGLRLNSPMSRLMRIRMEEPSAANWTIGTIARQGAAQWSQKSKEFVEKGAEVYAKA